MDCANLPSVFWLDHDYPRPRFEQRLATLSIAGGGWITIARCNDCGKLWRVDTADKYSVDLAIKLPSSGAWTDDDDRAARIGYLKDSYGGNGVSKCIWAGCQNPALRAWRCARSICSIAWE